MFVRITKNPKMMETGRLPNMLDAGTMKMSMWTSVGRPCVYTD